MDTPQTDESFDANNEIMGAGPYCTRIAAVLNYTGRTLSLRNPESPRDDRQLPPGLVELASCPSVPWNDDRAARPTALDFGGWGTMWRLNDRGSRHLFTKLGEPPAYGADGEILWNHPDMDQWWLVIALLPDGAKVIRQVNTLDSIWETLNKALLDVLNGTLIQQLVTNAGPVRKLATAMHGKVEAVEADDLRKLASITPAQWQEVWSRLDPKDIAQLEAANDGGIGIARKVIEMIQIVVGIRFGGIGTIMGLLAAVCGFLALITGPLMPFFAACAAILTLGAVSQGLIGGALGSLLALVTWILGLYE